MVLFSQSPKGNRIAEGISLGNGLGSGVWVLGSEVRTFLTNCMDKLCCEFFITRTRSEERRVGKECW